MMQTTTARRLGTRLLAAASGLAAVAAMPFVGSATAAASPGELVPGTPCHVGTSACVQLGHDGYNAKSWLIRDGQVARGPVSASSGGPGEDTPTGKYPVTSKDLHHVSTETTNAEGAPSPMPYSVFFGNAGMAFHGGGDPDRRTAGCVRLANPDAAYWFRNLNTGDRVEVVDSSAASAKDDRDDDGGDGGHHGGGLLGGL